MKPHRNSARFLLVLALISFVSAAPALADATITIVNVNAPGVGFNDPTPAASVPAAIKGDNPGATLGEMRLNAFRFAADRWGETLDSNVEIFIQASFVPLGAGVLGAAGAIQIFANFAQNGTYPGPQFADTWYHVALANKRSGTDLAPGPTNSNADDIVAFFSTNFTFYLGLDDNHGALPDLVTVLLHEFGHGLGFANFVTEATGQNAGPPFFTDIFSRYTLDETTNLHWNVMTDAERQASAINFKHVAWDGPKVSADVPTVLAFGDPFVAVNSPSAIAGQYQFGTAAFGSPISAPGVTGNVAVANDGVAPTSDACTVLPAGSLSGLIGLADRGTCGFAVKVKNMQDAGAIGAIIANNVVGAPPGLGGTDSTITISAVSVSLSDGNLIKANLPVNVTFGVDLSRRAGTSNAGFARLNAPNPVQPGSSISHWDPLMFPNQLMEPAINNDLTHSVQPPEDLTLSEMRDIGWFADADVDGVADSSDQCANSNLAPTVVIGSCDSGVPNTTRPTGCTISDFIAPCAVNPKNHGAYVSCVDNATTSLKKQGVISGKQKDAIMSCASGAPIP